MGVIISMLISGSDCETQEVPSYPEQLGLAGGPL